MSIFIRRAQSCDLDAIMHIQAQAYGTDLLESREVMQSRLHMPDSISCVLENATTVQAYLLMYISQRGYISAFNAPFNPVQPASNISTCLYLHDIACAKNSQGKGYAQTLLQHATQLAHATHCQSLALVAVQNALPFWQKQGFQTQDLPSAQARQQLAGYGQAWYCVKNLLD